MWCGSRAEINLFNKKTINVLIEQNCWYLRCKTILQRLVNMNQKKAL